MKINVEKLADNAVLPTYGTDHSAGMDLYAIIPDTMNWAVVSPRKTKLIHTGISVEIPDGYFGAIFARSGLAVKEGLRPANCVGVIDSDYRGEVMVALRNDSDVTRYISNGERVAQMVIIPYERAELNEVKILGETERGAGGFGSTGKN